MSYTKADLNFWIAEALFMSSSKRGHVREGFDLLLTHCGFPVTAFNRAVVKNLEADPEDVIARSRAFFAEKELPWQLNLRDDQEASWADALQTLGFERDPDSTPVMTYDLSGGLDSLPKPPEPEGLEVEVVRDVSLVPDYAATAFGGFELPVAGAGLFINELLFARPEVTCLLGRVDGELASTSMVVQTGDVSGIYWVSTLPEFRGRGLGEALTWAAVRSGAEQGGRSAILQASKMGHPVYARMGFDRPYSYAGWIPPEQAAR